MIVVDHGPSLRLITQSDHAHFSAELLALWRSDGLPDHPRRKAILFAAREHDNGWREADAAPRVDPGSGRPYDFLTLPDPLRRELWQRGVDRFSAENPYATLLILRHALEIHRDRRGDEGWQEFFTSLEERQAGLFGALEPEESDLADDYRFIALADRLSLAACNAWTDPFAIRSLRLKGRFEDNTLYLDPFPLAGATTFRISCRHIPDRPYVSDTELTMALARARWEQIRIKVAEGGW